MKKFASIMVALVMTLTLMPAAVWATDSDAVTSGSVGSDAASSDTTYGNETTIENIVAASSEQTNGQTQPGSTDAKIDSTTVTQSNAGTEGENQNTTSSASDKTGGGTEENNAANSDSQSTGSDEADTNTSQNSASGDQDIQLPALTKEGAAGNSESNADATVEEQVAKVGETTYKTLIDAVNAAYELGEGQTITLLKNYEVQTGAFASYLLPSNSVFDLGGNTLTVPYAKAVFEGENITIQNGRFESNANYAIWIGNGYNTTSATLKDITSNAGINVFVADATIDGYSIDASNKTYYAVWADNGGSVVINAGQYYGGENGVIGTASNNSGEIEIFGGSFNFDRLVPSEDNDNIIIHAGTFSNEIDSKYVDEQSNLIKIGNTWMVAPKDQTVNNEDGSTTETTSKVDEDGNSTVTETTTKVDEETGTETKEEVAVKTDTTNNTIETVNTKTETTKDESGTVTETKNETAVVTKEVEGKTVEVEKTTTEATIITEGDTTTTSEVKTVENKETNTTTETKTEVVASKDVTTTEQTVTTTDENTKEATVVTTKNVADKQNNVATTTVVDKTSGTAAVTTEIGTDGTTKIPAKVTVDATAAKVDASSVKKTEVTLPATTVSALNQAASDPEKKVESVEVKTDVVTLSIDNTALKTLTDSQASVETGGLVLSVEKTDETVDKKTSVTATYELKASVDGVAVFDKDNAETNGKITIGVPYELAASGNTLTVYYVDENGVRTNMNAKYENGVLMWTTNHFSTFEVVETANVEPIDPVNPDDQNDSNDKNKDENGDDTASDNISGNGSRCILDTEIP